jgi:GTP-binding protein
MIVNKAEKILTLGSDYYKIGFKDPVSISAEHGTGMADLYDTIALAISKIETKNDKGRQSNTKYPNLQLLNQSEEYNNLVNTALGNIEIVIAGRPNTGKSTFINSLLNEQRVLTGDMPGITRESIEIPLFYNKYLIKLIDTAGLRRKHNIKQRIEKLSSSDTIESIKFANTVILMLDATIALEQQDLNIANYVLEQGRSLIIVVNKWDLVLNKENFKSEIYYKLEHSLPQAKDISVVFISALNRENINSVLDSAIKTYTIWNSKISTSKLNNWINFAIERHPLSLQHNGRRVRIKYITQIKTRPPTFKLFTNYPEAMTDSYIKYLTNSMRDVFSLPGVPIRFHFSKSDNPYNKNKLSDKIKKSQ